MPSPFKGIKDAKARMDANYVRPGHYWVRLDKSKTGETRDKREFFANEMTVVHILEDGHTLEGKKVTHSIGESITHLIMAGDCFLGDVKAFIANVMEIPVDEIDEAACEAVVEEHGDDAQPLAGMVIEVYARAVETKRGNEFTKITYRREVPAQEVLDVLDGDTVQKFFPNGMLQAQVAEND